MRRLVAAGLTATLVACGSACSARHTASSGSPPPRAEFLLANADSTFWVGTSNTAVHARGVPITLAHFGGRFYELYTADDDFSYDDALLIGERLYRRDLASGDSAIVFSDTTVHRIAAAYARAHPDERPLAPDEEGADDPATAATSQVDVLDVFGPYVSFEYHVDVDMPGITPWHATRRGVLDLRSGSPVTVADLFGKTAARALADSARRQFQSTRDSIVAGSANVSADDRVTVDALLALSFDERSFTLSAINGKPAIAFEVPGRGAGVVGDVIELAPMIAQPTTWWDDIAPGLASATEHDDDLWQHDGFHVIARYDTAGESAAVALGDSTGHEWQVTSLLAPIRNITWLDDPPLDAGMRDALTRAFNEAASYDESARLARNTSPFPSVARRFLPAPAFAYASLEKPVRKSSRNVRAHDAGARQQHGPRVRRRGALDDGQGRGHRSVPALSGERGHRVDRSRGLPPAHSSRRPGSHEGQRELRRPNVHGSGRPG